MSQRLLFTLVVFLAVANLLIWSFLGFTKAYAMKVYPGVWVNTQPLTGLTRGQVIDQLQSINQTMTKEKITLVLDNKEYQPTLGELGYQVNTAAIADAALHVGRGTDLKKIFMAILDYQKAKSVPLTYSVDQEKLDQYLSKINSEVTKEPKNISLDYKDGGIVVVPAEDGFTVNKDQLKNDIQRQVQPGTAARIVLGYQKTPAKVSQESQVADAKAQLLKLTSQPLKLQAAEVTDELTPAQIYSFVYYEIKDNNLVVKFDQNKVTTAISQFAKKVDIAAVSKQVSEANQQILQEGQDGRQLDVPDTTNRIMARLQAADMAAPVVLKVDPVNRKTLTISPEYQLGRYPGRYIEVDLSAQRMHLIEGDAYHKTFIISTGKWSTPTPIGNFKVKNHITIAWSNPFKLYMPEWMGLETENGMYEGYGIHGLPYTKEWKENPGHLGTPVSHGCIRLGPGDDQYAYEWTQNGTPVIIHQ